MPRKQSLLRRLAFDAALILAITLVILAIAIFRKPSQGAMLYYQHQSLANTWRQNEPAYFTAPALRTLTVAAMTHFGEDDDDPTLPEGTDDHCIPLPDHLVPPGGIGDPPALARLNPYLQYLLPDGMQILFCHRLPSDSGDRLVILAVGPDRRHAAGLFPPLAYEAVIIDPASWTSSPHVVGRQRGPLTNPWLDAAPATFLMGHPDGPNLVIPYSAANHPFALTAHLLPSARRLVVSPQ